MDFNIRQWNAKADVSYFPNSQHTINAGLSSIRYQLAPGHLKPQGPESLVAEDLLPKEHGLENAFDFPGFVPAYIRPLFCEGKGPFRWAALSGDAADIRVTDDVIRSLFPENKSLMRWFDLAQEKIAFQGLPARICWLGQGDREKAGLAFNELVRKGKVKAPIVIGRDHLDTGSVASPNRETEAMLDGSEPAAAIYMNFDVSKHRLPDSPQRAG